MASRLLRSSMMHPFSSRRTSYPPLLFDETNKETHSKGLDCHISKGIIDRRDRKCIGNLIEGTDILRRAKKAHFFQKVLSLLPGQ